MMKRPLDELLGFLKEADNFTQDTRNWPDPTEPRASHPPQPKGCTCEEGLKLECPIHGMDADPSLVDRDHSWSLPQSQPIGFQQDGPRNWTQAVSHTKRPQDTSTHPSHQAYQQMPPDRHIDHDVHGEQLHQVQGHQENIQFGPQSISDSFAFSSSEVSNGLGESKIGFSDFRDVEHSFVPFGFGQHTDSPIDEGLQDDSHSFSPDLISFSSFGVHSSLPSEVGSDGENETNDDTNTPQADPHGQRHANDSQHNSDPANEIAQGESVLVDKSHKWSITQHPDISYTISVS